MTIHSTREFIAVPARATALAAVGSAQPATLFGAGATIYAEGDTAGALYRVDFGCVRICRLLADGRRQISAFHLAGEVFGFEAGDTRHFSAETVAATAVRAIRPAVAAEAASELLPLALHGLVRAQEHLLVLGRQNAVERVAAFLVDMADRQGGLERFDLAMSRTDIADYLGLTIETVSRVFSRLRTGRAIRLHGLRSIEILRWSQLRAMCA